MSIHLRSFSKKNNSPVDSFPFNVPVVTSLSEIEFESKVTFFIGENGTGKSTILEAIAVGLKLPAIGSNEVGRDRTLDHAHKLASRLKFVKSGTRMRGFFFRSEDFFGFQKQVLKAQVELQELEEEYSKGFQGTARDLSVGMARSQRAALERRYGENPDGYSHGEAMLNVLQNRLTPKGLYLMDEPETPLSPIRQIALLSMLKDRVEDNCQFIIATHSPILMAFPGAQLLSFEDNRIQQVAYSDVEHVNITRAFLNDPESFLHRL